MRFQRRLLALLPEDTHDRVTKIITATMTAGKSEKPASVVLLAFDLLAQELGHLGVLV